MRHAKFIQSLKQFIDHTPEPEDECSLLTALIEELNYMIQFEATYDVYVGYSKKQLLDEGGEELYQNVKAGREWLTKARRLRKSAMQKLRNLVQDDYSYKYTDRWDKAIFTAILSSDDDTFLRWCEKL